MGQIHSNFDVLTDSYLENKIGVDSQFLSPSLSEGLFQNILQLQLEEKLTAAGIGNDRVKDARQTTRSDRICWMDQSNENIFEKEFFEKVEQFIAHLNSTCYTGINSYEFHYAVYGEGCYYKRHKDQFRNDSKRKYSLISYLNENWLEEDGGQLLVYKEEGVQHIIPQSQTAVFFKSDEMDHEVTVSKRDRMSITGWLKQV